MLTVHPQGPGSDDAPHGPVNTADGVSGLPIGDATAPRDTRYRYRHRPCDRCPWRVDRLGAFPPAAFRQLARTAYDTSLHSFVCHESSDAVPFVCAGFLLRGAAHNLAVRLRLARGEIDPDVVHDGGHALHGSYRDMAVANGVDPDDPALAACREGPDPS